MVVSRLHPGFPVPSILGCSAGFGLPCTLAFSCHYVLSLYGFFCLGLSFRSYVPVSASFPTAFSEFPVLLFSSCSIFCSPSRYKSERFPPPLPCPSVSFFLHCVRAHIRKELTASSTSSSLGSSGAVKPASFFPERHSHRASASTVSRGTWDPLGSHTLCFAAPYQACSHGEFGSQKPSTRLQPLPALQLLQGCGVYGGGCFLWLIINWF